MRSKSEVGSPDQSEPDPASQSPDSGQHRDPDPPTTATSRPAHQTATVASFLVQIRGRIRPCGWANSACSTVHAWLPNRRSAPVVPSPSHFPRCGPRAAQFPGNDGVSDHLVTQLPLELRQPRRPTVRMLWLKCSQRFSNGWGTLWHLRSSPGSSWGLLAESRPTEIWPEAGSSRLEFRRCCLAQISARGRFARSRSNPMHRLGTSSIVLHAYSRNESTSSRRNPSPERPFSGQLSVDRNACWPRAPR